MDCFTKTAEAAHLVAWSACKVASGTMDPEASKTEISGGKGQMWSLPAAARVANPQRSRSMIGKRRYFTKLVEFPAAADPD